MEKVEDIILRHSQRGMLKLKEYMSESYCREAAEMILGWEKGVIFLTTGFYVAGFPETDGPAGTFVLSRALQQLGYEPVIITEAYCDGFFEEEGIPVIYMKPDADVQVCKELLAKWNPTGIIFIEKCGVNIAGDYANMRGVSIKEHTAPVDLLFNSSMGKIPSIGIGDGGNEIGMGNLSGVILNELSIVPCVTHVDHLVIASVSNWGAYGIAAYLEMLTGRNVMMEYQEVYDFIAKTVKKGSVDGLTRERTISVDGFPITVEQEIIESLCQLINQTTLVAGA